MQMISTMFLTGIVLAGSLAATKMLVPDLDPTTHEVRMVQAGDSYRFEPANLTIKKGDRVRFVTVSGEPHNVAFDPEAIPTEVASQLAANMSNRIGPLAGPLLTKPGESYTISFAGVKAGTYPYFCMPHVAMGMKGTIKVE